MITLASPAMSASVSPEHGGIITSLDWHGADGHRHHLLYCGDARPSREAPNFMGLWPMLPFANRAFDCLVDDGTESFAVPVNDAAGTGNIHGFGWQSAWHVVARDASSCVLAHERAGTADPYAYVAHLTITLGDQRAQVHLSITNRANRALAYGAGFHPWFRAAPDSRFSFSSRGHLAFGEAFRATGLIKTADGGSFAAGAPVGSLGHELAVSAVDWTGTAVLSTPSHGLELHIEASQNFRHPVLWAPPHADFVCFEPQSHAIGAPSLGIARAITPLARLQPGETLQGWMSLEPRSI